MSGIDPPEIGAHVVLLRDAFAALLAALRADGYVLVGPTVRDGAIVYREIEGAQDLPVGWTEEQEAGSYRLRRRGDDAVFGHTVGPNSWKERFFVPRRREWRARRDGAGFQLEPEPSTPTRIALVGARSCDLHAIAIQDTVFLAGAVPDADYAARREDVFVVAVNCGQAGGTCFCVSMGTGPRASAGFDVALTEVLEDGRHYFLVEAGSEGGAEVVAGLPARDASPDERAAGDRAIERAVAGQGRTMDTTDLKGLLYRNYEHPRWDDVADRCLTCGNCTMVCPTCFCTSAEEVTDLTGTETERVREWDSCFTLDFSYVHGGSVRNTPRSRYRQWMTHKLATWGDQFDTFGCVGCGRCITWCPVAIDITEEVAAIRATDSGGPAAWEEGKS